MRRSELTPNLRPSHFSSGLVALASPHPDESLQTARLRRSHDSASEYASEFRYRNPIINNKTVVIAISQSVKLERLVALNLAKNNITNTGAKALAESSGLGKLKTLNLNFNKIGDEGAFAIAQSSGFSKLESLKLGQNKIGTEGAQALNESKNLKNLIHPIFGFY